MRQRRQAAGLQALDQKVVHIHPRGTTPQAQRFEARVVACRERRRQRREREAGSPPRLGSPCRATGERCVPGAGRSRGTSGHRDDGDELERPGCWFGLLRRSKGENHGMISLMMMEKRASSLRPQRVPCAIPTGKVGLPARRELPWQGTARPGFCRPCGSVGRSKALMGARRLPPAGSSVGIGATAVQERALGWWRLGSRK